MKLLFASYIILIYLMYNQMHLVESFYNFCNLSLKEANFLNSCYPKDNDHFLLCHNGLHDKWLQGSRSVRTIILCEWPEDELHPMMLLSKFPMLRKLTIANSNLSSIQCFTSKQVSYLEKIDIVNTQLQSIPKECFTKLAYLKSLDLRNNSLSALHPDDVNVPSLQSVYLFVEMLTGNIWKCDSDLEWILDSSNGSLANKIVDKQKLQCFKPHEGRPLIPVMEVIKSLRIECQDSVCDCMLVYVVGRAGRQTQRQLMAFASMNCSYRGLSEMPTFLPANISALYLIGNKITDLTPLKTNPFYKRVIDIYLDDNLIESISVLDGTYWLEHFRLLSLRGNKLTYLPTYALEYVLSHSTNAVSLYLGNNPWRCDCLFTPGFQELMIRYPNLVKDVDNVRCASNEDDENSDKHIRDLTRTEICVSSEDHWVHPLDVLNIILALLIVFVLGKLAFDYRSFKKSGKLPWIINQIP